MDQLVPVLLLAAVFAAVLAAMYLGWRRRGRSQSHLPSPLLGRSLAELEEDAEHGPVDAVYVDTVLADQPLERVVAHGLGTRAPARVTLTTGGSWHIERRGAASLTIPSTAIDSTGAAPGIAGKFIGGDGLLVIRWQLGDQQLDTGLRLAHRADHDLLLARKEHP